MLKCWKVVVFLRVGSCLKFWIVLMEDGLMEFLVSRV